MKTTIVSVLLLACGSLVTPTFGSESAHISNTSSSSSSAHAVTQNQATESVVYTYSEANVRDGKPTVSQLTIGKGKDGKYHYAKNENGTIQTGIWDGPLPQTPDVNKMVGDSMNEITKELANPLTQLSLGIDSSMKNYLQTAFQF